MKDEAAETYYGLNDHVSQFLNNDPFVITRYSLSYICLGNDGRYIHNIHKNRDDLINGSNKAFINK